MSSEAKDREAPPARPVKARRKNTAPTIYDIAKLAGVNPSTVSRALSQPGRVNINTEQRIQAAAKELNYRLNPMARALPTGRTSTLGLLLADITNPMFFGVVRGAERAAAERGYILLLAESQESREREAEAAERVLPSVDGLVLVTTRLHDEQIADLAERKPLIVINRDVAGVSSLVPDVRPGIDQAIAHLAELGHSSIAYLAGPENSWMSSTRWSNLQAVALQRGVNLQPIGPGIPTLDGGRSALPRIIASGVTAVIAYNDLMAIGLLLAAIEQGIAVPGRLSIVGFDDIFGSDFTSPALTTVRTPLDLLGDQAIRRALELVDSQSGADVAAVKFAPIATELVIRGSTGPVREIQ